MVKKTERPEMLEVDPRLEERLEAVEEDLDIMERHAKETEHAEEGINSYLRQLDREYKDSRLHSIPKPRKHSL